MNNLADPHAAFAASLAQGADQPQIAYGALHVLADQLVGTKLFTILELDHKAGFMRRLYSDNTQLYPVPGADPIGDSVWERTIIGKRQPLVLNTAKELGAVLPEYPKLAALGCHSMLNLPIVVCGLSIGTLNMLNDEGHFTPERVAQAYSLTAAAATCLLMSKEPAND